MWRARFAGLVFAVVIAFGAPLAAFAQDGERRASANLDGCEGVAVSRRPDGSIRDRVVGPGERKSSADEPFHVGADDTVQWAGRLADAAGDFRWRIKVAGITMDEGEERGGRVTEWTGEKKVGDLLPFKLTGVYHLEWELDGETHSCRGDLWIMLDGNPIWTTPWFIGAGLLLLAAGGIWLARPSRRGKVSAAQAEPATDEAGP